jgi:hypothetical protein
LGRILWPARFEGCRRALSRDAAIAWSRGCPAAIISRMLEEITDWLLPGLRGIGILLRLHLVQ